MTVSPPRVSICIPTYNSAAFLEEALESVWAQDFRDYEVVMVDDGSSDDTVRISAAFAARDPRIRCFVNPYNLGISTNCNRCMELARGSYIKFLFADDVLLAPDALARMAAALDAHPGVALVACARRIIDGQSRLLQEIVSYADGLHCPGSEVARHCLIDVVNRIGEPTAVLFRRRVGRPGFDPDYCQLLDFEMWLRLLEEGDFFYLGVPLVGFRLHDGQATQNNRRSLAHLADHRRLLQKYPGKKGLGPGRLGRLLARLQQCEKIWRLHARKKVLTRHEAKEEIAHIMAPGRFFLLRPLYRLILRNFVHPLYIRCLAPKGGRGG
ncbi:MAG: glycosyltransferase [Syntrophotaleaceae bacterium]